MKKTYILLLLLVSVMLTGCGAGKAEEQQSEQKETENQKNIVVGFSQLGAESDWRRANTESMKATFTPENGYELIFDDGQQKQINQITAIRTFIQQEVDYIVLAPVMETGWETVLQEAKDANIPVIIVDRMVDVKDESLFTCWVGSNFELEAKKTCEWLKQYCESRGIQASDLHIVNIQGTLGGSAQIGRTKGLRDAAKTNGWDLMAQATGDYTQAKGQEVMEAFLKKYDDINVVYCENDNEAFGAIAAIEAAGMNVGSDINGGEIMVLSFDGVKKEALEYALEDKITCLAECNPLHGPRVQSIIETLEEGGTPEKYEYVSEDIFCAKDTVQKLTIDGANYTVTNLTQEFIDNRIY